MKVEASLSNNFKGIEVKINLSHGCCMVRFSQDKQHNQFCIWSVLCNDILFAVDFSVPLIIATCQDI